MIHLIKYFLLTLAIPFLLYSQVIDVLEINGNSTFNDSEIESWAGIGKGTRVYAGILDTLESRIAYNLSLNGYFNPEFSGSNMEFYSDSQQVKVIMYVDEGGPSYIRNVVVTSNDSLRLKPFIPIFKYLQGQIFNQTTLKDYIIDALTKLENTGNPFAVFSISTIHFYYDSTDENHYADIYLNLETGLTSNIDKVEVQGSSSTKDYVIVRELRIEPGEPYSQEKIEEFPKRLNRLRFFEPVSTPQFYVDSDNKGVLVVNIKDRQTNNFDGIIGYIPPAGDVESGYITGLLNVSLRNLFGTGRAAAFRWRKIDRYSQELEFKYLEPWLFSFPLNLNAGFFQRQQDTTYVQRTLTGGLEYLATEDVSAAVFITSQSTIPTVREDTVFTVYNSTAFTTGVNLKIDTRDDPLAPTSGIFFNNFYDFSQKRINGPQEFITPETLTEINLQRFEVTLALFYQFFQRQVLAFKINGRELRGPFFEESDLYWLGGTQTLRGYREDQFRGNRVFWINLEYRLFLARRTYTYLFLDNGYYLRNAEERANIPKQEGYKIGYGFGLNLETAIGILGVSFALAKGNSFSDGLIHFDILNEF
ncbi:MAG: POTRA domain-containing protein [Ignavibacteriaceae bacterium]